MIRVRVGAGCAGETGVHARAVRAPKGTFGRRREIARRPERYVRGRCRLGLVLDAAGSGW